jgi:signal peptidase II
VQYTEPAGWPDGAGRPAPEELGRIGHNGVMTEFQHAEPASAGEEKIAEIAPRPRRTGLLAAAAGITLVLDVLSKIIVVMFLEGCPPVKLLGGALYLVVYRNSGAAFSLGTGLTWVLSLIAVAVVVVIIRLASRLRSAGWALGLGLVLGGALGNLVDRLLRAPGPLRGHVVDFLSLLAPDGSVWPVFNLADSAIVCGGVLLVFLAATGRDFDGTRGTLGARSQQ